MRYNRTPMQPMFWIWLVLLPALAETALLVWKPTWLVWAAQVTMREHRFGLARPRRAEVLGASYRDLAQTELPLPELRFQRELSDAMLFCEGHRAALRRSYMLGRRQMWLVGIEMRRDGNEVVLHARWTPSPLALVFVVPALMIAFANRPSVITTALPIWLVMVPLIVGVNFLVCRGGLEFALDEAFDTLERELRAELEEAPLRP